MSSRATHPPSHPVARRVAHIRAELAALNETPLWSMSTEEAAATLAETTHLNAQAADLELRLAAHADRVEVGAGQGATSTAVWWANQTHLTQREAASKMKLAHALEAHEPVEEALGRGSVLVDQAKVIVEAVDALPRTSTRPSAPRRVTTSSPRQRTSTPRRCASKAGGSSTSSRPRSVRRKRPASSPPRRRRPSRVRG